MGTDQINAVIRHEIKISCITFMKIHFTVSTFVFKCCFFFTTSKSNVINICTNNVSVKQFCFYKGGTTTRKLIEN